MKAWWTGIHVRRHIGSLIFSQDSSADLGQRLEITSAGFVKGWAEYSPEIVMVAFLGGEEIIFLADTIKFSRVWI